MPFAQETTRSRTGLPLAVYAELVRRLFSNTASIAAMGLLFAIFGGVVAARQHEAVISVMVALGSASSFGHALVGIAYRRATPARSYAATRRWERRYAACGLASAFFLGLTSARVFSTDDLGSGMLMTGLIFGYSAGTMARTAVRPWICAPRILLLVILPIIALESRGEFLFAAHGLLLGLFAIAGMETISSVYRHAVSEIELLLREKDQAGHDPLTGLANRRSLTEFLDQQAMTLADASSLAAIHCIDLDRFKAVNDDHGHPVGDALLCAVSERLRGVMRPNDLVARLGGDEFVVVQTGLADHQDATRIAERIVGVLRKPYRLGGQDIETGASVGTAIAAGPHADLGRILAEADTALYASKLRGRNTFTVHGGPPRPPAPTLAEVA